MGPYGDLFSGGEEPVTETLKDGSLRLDPPWSPRLAGGVFTVCHFTVELVF